MRSLYARLHTQYGERIDRREMIRQSLAAAAGVLVGNRLSYGAPRPSAPRVISFHDLVPGAAMEGGAELIGTNQPIWMDYQQRFGLRFVDITEEDAEAPIVLGGQRLTAALSEQLWKDMSVALNGLNAGVPAVPQMGSNVKS
jgi:hypothetical protein